MGTWMTLGALSSKPHYYWNTLSVLLVVLVLMVLPVKWAIRYEESELEPLIKASRVAARLNGSTSLALLLNAAFWGYCALRRRGSREEAYDLCLALTLLVSWTLMMVYLFGLRIICSERFLAISRHPIFLFRRDLLSRYLKSKNPEGREG
jgi:NADH:ubiquinone oxidoreductase subunit 2 (subunit N)